MVKAYCFKCKKKVEVKGPHTSKMKGRTMTKGTDAKGHKVSVIGAG